MNNRNNLNAAPWFAHVTVATIVERQGRFLMVKEIDNGSFVFNQPAGHLEEGETLLEAAIRETREETGWRVEPTFLLGVSQYQAPANAVTYLRFSFIAKHIEQDSLTVLDSDIIEALWLTYEEVSAMQSELRSPMVLRDIERYRNGQRYPLELVWDYATG